MNPYDEEMQARFISGMDAAIMVLQGAVDTLKEAKAAAVANNPVVAFNHFETTMNVLRDLIEQSKKDPKF